MPRKLTAARVTQFGQSSAKAELAVRIASARTRLGFQLVVGALLLITAAWIFGAIAEDVVTGDPLTLLDERVAQWLHLHASAGMTRWMLLVSAIHSTVAMAAYASIAGLVAIRRRQWRRLTALAVCMGGGLLLNLLMKLAFHRPRPHFTDPILTLASYSFPSGHVAASTIFYTLCIAWVFGHTRALRWRLLAIAAAALGILLVAFSRMYLGVHYLSDVGAAFAEGIAWVSLCLSAIAAFSRETSAAPLAPDTRAAPS
jgi:membrane-associated phospholipid phosphatase